VGGAVADVLVVEPLRLTRPGRDRLHGLADQLLAGLVQGDQGSPVVVGPVVDLQHILHGTDELGIGLGRDAPLLPQPGLDLVFFSARRTVSSQTLSTTRNSTSWSARSCIVHSLRPSAPAPHPPALPPAPAPPSPLPPPP